MLTSGDSESGTLGFREVWWTFSIAWISGTLGTVSIFFLLFTACFKFVFEYKN